ncbi:MAG: pyridoxal phosphate-dependent class II aminotransferase, partial [Rhizobiales bacterium]|nr:pyridoxal phosphate-dependent class II aminotransferase [Hyphomicrobiales bacterium]
LAKIASIAAQSYGAPSAAHVVPAPGTQILLPLVAALVDPGRAAVVAPTYREHARAAALAGHRVAEIADLTAAREAILVIVTNPNNPDGRLFDKNELIGLAKRLASRGGLLVVDEAFMDVGPAGASLAGEVGRNAIVVLRSFGKFSGLAGIRLGFGLAPPQLAARLSAKLGPWAVSGPALAIGMTALADRMWIEEQRKCLIATADRLKAILLGARIEIVGGTALFQLAKTPAASDLFHHLGRAGILVRRFPEHSSWLRFGLPGTEKAWARLQIAMVAYADTH